MAIYNSADTTYAVVAETVAGTVPATPAFLQLPYIPGTMPTFTADQLESNVRLPTRGNNGIRLTNFRVGGGNKVHFKRDASVELLLSSALSATWTSNVLTAGKTETSLTIEECRTDGTNKTYERYSGVLVSGFSFDLDFSGNCEADFEYVGMNMTNATAIVTGATYTAPDLTKIPLTGLDVTSLTIAGLTGVEATKLSLKVENTREAQGVFGTASARGVGTTERKVSGSITMYRKDMTPESVLVPGGVPADIAISFTIGSAAGNGYTFTIPAANFAQPQNAEDGSKVLVTLDFVATVDTTTQTDLKITRN